MPNISEKIKLPLVILPSFISLELGLSLLGGYVAALFLSGPKSRMPGILPSLIFKFKKYRIHLHHWLVFSSVLGASIVFHFFVIHPMLFYGALAGIAVQGILHYEDWHIVVRKI